MASYEIIVEGYLDARWLDWFEALQFTEIPAGRTLLSIHLPDQAALRGMLERIFDLNLKLISLRRVELSYEPILPHP